MKKIISILLLAAMLLTAVSCGGSEITTVETTTEETPSYDMPLPEGERIEKISYTAVLNDEVWTAPELDTAGYEFTGSGSDIYNAVSKAYKAYKTINWVIVKDGVETSYDSISVYSTLNKLGLSGATVAPDVSTKTATVTVTPVGVKVLPSWKAVSAKADSFIRFSFTTNVNVEMAVTVTAEPGGSSGSSMYTQDIALSGENGTYTGVARCTVPQYENKTCYLNICLKDGYVTLASVPINVTVSDYHTGYQLVFVGDWDLVEDESYFDKYVDLFHHFFPKAHTRWGILESDSKVVKYRADKTYDGVAYQSGGQVTVSVDYLNNGPDKLTIIGHEMTHVVEQYGGKLTYGEQYYEDGRVKAGWWTENLANYGALRYTQYNYSHKFVQVFDVQKDYSSEQSKSLYDWGYGKYNDGGKIFIAWLDWFWPTLDKNGDGKAQVEEYGAVDYINYVIKTNTGDTIFDDPYDETTKFSQALYKITGFKTAEEARLQYVEDCKSGKFVFDGFANYKDNWVTENIPGVTNDIYIMKGTVTPSSSTHARLEVAMTTGDNLVVGATVDRANEPISDKNAQAYLVDGDLSTAYQAKSHDKMKQLTGLANEMVIDLGKVKTFDTYTLVSSSDKATQVLNSFEILISNDGVHFTGVDTQLENTDKIVSVSFDEVSARYVMIRVFKADSSAYNTTRLAEFMLFNQ